MRNRNRASNCPVALTLTGPAHVYEIAVIAEQRLPEPILDIESDNRTGDVGMGLTKDAHNLHTVFDHRRRRVQ